MSEPNRFRFDAPWHKASYDQFLFTRLPELLAERLPLAGYIVSEQPEARTCRVTVEVAVNSHSLPVEYTLPAPDAQGLFALAGAEVPLIVVPLASEENLEQAEVDCVGEQLVNYLTAQLGHAPAEAAWDEALLRAFLPLDGWVTAFLQNTAQRLDVTNWSARTTHLRRILVPSRKQIIAPGQQGRVDPYETPEGPNIGKVFTIALGAEIREGKIVIVDSSPEGALGHNAAMVPFLEHDDANRLLMGVNMMRQGLVPPEAEPPLVQTGLEPDYDGPDLWCGRNLLTAFVAWGEGCVEDGLILSESCARRLNYPYPAEAGDKLANRHGTKGVVSQVLPDAQMPHLADGTPVEIVFSFTGLHRRLNFGQEREALLGRIARAEGRPAIARPFQSPDEAELRARLAAAGLPESGMERLRAGQNGPEMPYPSLVGWVYWYRLAHLARAKLRVVALREQAGDAGSAEAAPRLFFPAWESSLELGDLELGVLRQLGALQTARETLTTRALRFDATAPNGSFSPYYADLAQRLAAAGIHAKVAGGQLRLHFGDPTGGDVLTLARPLPHPWLGERMLTQVGAPPPGDRAAAAAFAALREANQRLARLLETRVPALITTMINTAAARLDGSLSAYLDALLPAAVLRASERQRACARAVIAPGVGLRLDQIGLPREIAEGLFNAAGDELEARMAGRWVVAARSPAVTPTSLVAFHPLVVDGPAIRLHPQACELLNTDFDGDLLQVFLPLAEEAQREAGEKLSILGHLRRDPRLVEALHATHEGVWGLAYLSLTDAGREQMAAVLPAAAEPRTAAELRTAADRIPAPFRQADQVAALAEILAREGPEAAMHTANALAHLGYAAASASGASLSPFPRSQVALPPAPLTDDPTTWEAYKEACAEAVLSGHDYLDPNLGPQLLSAAVRPRSRWPLPYLISTWGTVQNAAGQTVIMRHGLAEGRTPEEQFAVVRPAREGLARLAFEYDQILSETGGLINQDGSTTFTVLARARRSRRPGIVFARAAASGEADPLTDVETRILLGIAD